MDTLSGDKDILQNSRPFKQNTLWRRDHSFGLQKERAFEAFCAIFALGFLYSIVAYLFSLTFRVVGFVPVCFFFLYSMLFNFLSSFALVPLSSFFSLGLFVSFPTFSSVFSLSCFTFSSPSLDPRSLSPFFIWVPYRSPLSPSTQKSKSPIIMS